MFLMFRYALVAILVGSMTVNPAWAYYGMDCGCSAVESEPVVTSDDCAACGAEVDTAAEVACDSVVPCESCEPCTKAIEQVEESAVDYADCGCEGANEGAPIEAQPVEAPKHPEQLPVQDPKPVADAPVTPPATTVPPVTTEKPLPPANVITPAEPATTTPAAPVETAPPVETPPPVETTPPVETPSEPPAEEADDLFGEPAAESTPPAEESTADEAPAEDPATEESPAEESTEFAAPADDPLEDFFNAVPRPNALQVAGGLESQIHRTWTDNTGKYRCEARLVSVELDEVVLHKADGQPKRVPLVRLSDADLTFVHEQVVAKREMLAQSGLKLADR